MERSKPQKIASNRAFRALDSVPFFLRNSIHMKIGIVSDIHADPKALRRALENMPSTDVLLCPGDAVSEYRFCPETVEILQQARVLCIQGNHELVLFGGRNPAYL